MKKNMRVGTTISMEMNEWLDEQSVKTGLTKSALILISIENYKNQKEAQGQLNELAVLVEEMKKLAEKVEKE